MGDLIKSIVSSAFTLLTILIGIYTYIEQLRISNTSSVAREALRALEDIRNKIWQIEHRSEEVDVKAIVELQAAFGSLQSFLYLLRGSPLIKEEDKEQLNVLIDDCIEFINHRYNLPLTLENNKMFLKLITTWSDPERNKILNAKKTLSRVYQMGDTINLGPRRWFSWRKIF